MVATAWRLFPINASSNLGIAVTKLGKSADRNLSYLISQALKDTNLEILDARRRTAFHVSCTVSSLDCITLLVSQTNGSRRPCLVLRSEVIFVVYAFAQAELGCDRNALDKEDNHPVHLAATHGSRQVMEKVLELGKSQRPHNIFQVGVVQLSMITGSLDIEELEQVRDSSGCGERFTLGASATLMKPQGRNVHHTHYCLWPVLVPIESYQIDRILW